MWFVPDADDIYVPGSLMEFPLMIETLPLWTFLGSFGWALAHELGHAIAKGLQEFAHWSAAQSDQQTSYYFSVFTVRCCAIVSQYYPINTPIDGTK